MVFIKQWLLSPLAIALFLSMVYGVGAAVLGFVTGSQALSDVEEIIFSIGIGLGIHSVIVLVLGLTVGVSPVLFLSESAVLFVLTYRRIATLWMRLWRFAGDGLRGKALRNMSGEVGVEETLALGLIVWVFLHGWATALAPPIDSDSLGYHLGNAAQYVREGRIFYQVGYPFTAFPGVLEMNYLFSVTLGLESLAQAIPLFLSACLVLLIALAGREFLGSIRIGIFGAALFAVQPVFTVSIGTAMQDGSAALFAFSGLYCLLKWSRTESDHWFHLGGIMAGLTISTKYSSAPFAPILLLVFLALQLRARKLSIKKLFLFGLLASAIFSPWMARNFVWTGNPVWPLANALFRGRDFSDRKADVLAKIESLPGQERTLKGLLLLPYRMITQFRFGHYYNPEYLTWPFLVLCAAVVYIRPAWPWTATIFLIFSLLSAVALYSTASFWRYFLPALPGFCLVFGWMLDQVRSRTKAAALAVLLLMTLAAVRLNSAHALFPACGFSYPRGSGAPRESYLRANMTHYPLYERLHVEVPEGDSVFLSEHYDVYHLGRRFVYADPLWQGRIDYWNFKDSGELMRLLQELGIRWVVINNTRNTVANPADRARMPDWYWHGQSLIRDMISKFGVQVEEKNGVALYRLSDAPNL